MKQIYDNIVKIAKELNAKSVILFGSRARGDNTPTSDIDIAVSGILKENQGKFWDKVDDIDTLLKIDIVHIDSKTSEELLDNIKKDGVSLMNKFEDKLSKLKSAVDRLEEAINEYKTSKSDTVRDGVIQRFEFCTELSWKTLREKLLDEGIVEINSPKSVVKEAFRNGIIKEETLWINLLSDRNSTSHIYDEETAKDIYTNIETSYITEFQRLIETLN